ncbi:hypothetical protein [Streptomyces sp. NPDC059909]|uniref:hypothetical protein n=1 Tax=Streptomyces sp. NPDC059909 TaxID=3346998 RepID=UPI003662E949
MKELTISLPEAEWAALADRADAEGRSAEEVAQEAVRRYMDLQSTLLRHEAMRLALRHAPLLRRLGE